MNLPTWVLILVIACGIALVIRAVAIVTIKGDGRFRGDPLITLVLGFGLVILGQALMVE